MEGKLLKLLYITGLLLCRISNFGVVSQVCFAFNVVVFNNTTPTVDCMYSFVHSNTDFSAFVVKPQLCSCVLLKTLGLAFSLASVEKHVLSTER